MKSWSYLGRWMTLGVVETLSLTMTITLNMVSGSLQSQVGRPENMYDNIKVMEGFDRQS